MWNWTESVYNVAFCVWEEITKLTKLCARTQNVWQNVSKLVYMWRWRLHQFAYLAAISCTRNRRYIWRTIFSDGGKIFRCAQHSRLLCVLFEPDSFIMVRAVEIFCTHEYSYAVNSFANIWSPKPHLMLLQFRMVENEFKWYFSKNRWHDYTQPSKTSRLLMEISNPFHRISLYSFAYL